MSKRIVGVIVRNSRKQNMKDALLKVNKMKVIHFIDY